MSEDDFKDTNIIISGYARLPENVTARHVFGYFSIELEVNTNNDEIVDCSTTMLPGLGQKILDNALLGNEVEKGLKQAIREIEERFFSVTKKAVIAALQDVYKWYEKSKGDVTRRIK